MVLVCHDKRFVFLKTRKTAGTSVEMFLQSLCAANDGPPVEKTHALVAPHYIVGRRRIPEAERNALDLVWYNHMPASDVRTQIGEDAWQSYRKIATVRNPFDLAVSQFYFRNETRGTPLPDDPDAHVAAFRKAVRTQKWRSSEVVVFDRGRFVPQLLVRQEAMEQDLKTVCDMLDLPFERGQLPVTKRTSNMRCGLAVADYYDNKTANSIKKIYGWLFDYAGYADTPAGEDQRTP